LYNPSSGAFLLRYSNSGGVPDDSFIFGAAGATPQLVPLKGRFNPPGIHDTIALYDPATGTFSLRYANTNGVPDLSFVYGPGSMGLIPLMGDWNGDGLDTPGLYNPASGAFLLRNSLSGGGADISFIYGPGGSAGYVPMAGDWNGDGTDTVGLYYPPTGVFILSDTNGGAPTYTFPYGPANMIPLSGDWTGQGHDTVGVYNPTNAAFLLINSNASIAPQIIFVYGPVGAGLVPIMGKWRTIGPAIKNPSVVKNTLTPTFIAPKR
jgi:hypothetical protein